MVALMVTEPYPRKMYGELMLSGIEPLRHYHDQERQLAERVLAPIEHAADAAGVGYSSCCVSGRSLADAIIATAEHEGCDLICMASENQRDLLGVHLARDATRVLTHARIPVLICH